MKKQINSENDPADLGEVPVSNTDSPSGIMDIPQQEVVLPPEPTPVAEPEKSLKELADVALLELESWHQNDDRFRRKLDAIRAYIESLEPKDK